MALVQPRSSSLLLQWVAVLSCPLSSCLPLPVLNSPQGTRSLLVTTQSACCMSPQLHLDQAHKPRPVPSLSTHGPGHKVAILGMSSSLPQHLHHGHILPLAFVLHSYPPAASSVPTSPLFSPERRLLIYHHRTVQLLPTVLRVKPSSSYT